MSDRGFRGNDLYSPALLYPEGQTMRPQEETSDIFVPLVELNVVDIFLDALFVAARAYHQHVVRIDHDIILQPLDDGDFACGNRDDRVARVVGIAAVVGFGIGVGILARELVDRAPRTHVAPAEVAAADIYVVGLLHDAVVDRYGAALREDLLDGGLLAVGAQILHDGREEGVVFGQMAAEGLDYAAHLPDEDAGVPEELAALYECLRQLQIGFLGEALDAADDVVVRLLDISVSRIGTAGLDSDGHQGVVAVGKLEALAYDGMEIGLVEDEVVGRRDDHLRLGVDLAQRVGRIGYAGCRVAPDGLAQHLPRLQLGYMLQYEVAVAAVGDDKKILDRHDGGETLEGRAYERLSRAENVKELLGLDLSAHGPEAGPYASGHDYAVGVAAHVFMVVYLRVLYLTVLFRRVWQRVPTAATVLGAAVARGVCRHANILTKMANKNRISKHRVRP